jgi:hypothetical protein
MMRRYAAVTDQTLRAAAEAVSRSEWVNLSSAGQIGEEASSRAGEMGKGSGIVGDRARD